MGDAAEEVRCRCATPAWLQRRGTRGRCITSYCGTPECIWGCPCCWRWGALCSCPSHCPSHCRWQRIRGCACIPHTLRPGLRARGCRFCVWCSPSCPSRRQRVRVHSASWRQRVWGSYSEPCLWGSIACRRRQRVRGQHPSCSDGGLRTAHSRRLWGSSRPCRRQCVRSTGNRGLRGSRRARWGCRWYVRVASSRGRPGSPRGSCGSVPEEKPIKAVQGGLTSALCLEAKPLP